MWLIHSCCFFSELFVQLFWKLWFFNYVIEIYFHSPASPYRADAKQKSHFFLYNHWIVDKIILIEKNILSMTYILLRVKIVNVSVTKLKNHEQIFRLSIIAGERSWDKWFQVSFHHKFCVILQSSEISQRHDNRNALNSAKWNIEKFTHASVLWWFTARHTSKENDRGSFII